MKTIFLSALVVFFAAGNVSARSTDLSCKAKKGDIEIILNTRLDIFDEKNKIGLMSSYDLLIFGEVSAEYNGIVFKDHVSMSDKNVKNSPYKGKKYKGYLKFELADYDSKTLSQNGDVDLIDFIVSPKYKVLETKKSGNYWDKNWTWDVETREYNVVFPISLDDHHGDYIKGKCYSKVRVNEVHPKQ